MENFTTYAGALRLIKENNKRILELKKQDSFFANEVETTYKKDLKFYYNWNRILQKKLDNVRRKVFKNLTN